MTYLPSWLKSLDVGGNQWCVFTGHDTSFPSKWRFSLEIGLFLFQWEKGGFQIIHCKALKFEVFKHPIIGGGFYSIESLHQKSWSSLVSILNTMISCPSFDFCECSLLDNWEICWSIFFLNYLCTFSSRSERYSINVSENADPQVFYSIKIVTLCQIVAEINWLESAPNSLKVHSYMIMFLRQCGFCFSSMQKWQL